MSYHPAIISYHALGGFDFLIHTLVCMVLLHHRLYTVYNLWLHAIILFDWLRIAQWGNYYY